MEILIDDTHYHLEEETKEELSFVNGVIASLFSTYPGERQCLDDIYKHAGVDKTNEKASFEYKVIKSILKSLKDRFGNTLQREQLLKLVKTTLNKELPYVLENEKDFITSRHIYYEPEFVYSYYLATRIRKEVDNHINEYRNDAFEFQLVLLLNNIARSVKSIVVLTSLGDDAHAYSINRGLIELVCTMMLCGTYKEDWLLFSGLNYELSEYIQDRNKITPELEAFFKMFNFDLDKPEKVSLFTQIGWALNNSGRRCRSVKEFIYAAYGDNGDEVYSEYRNCSIMTHEAYSISSVDWNILRIKLKDVSNYCCYVYRILSESLDWFNEHDKNAFKYLNNLNEIDWENI